jgi:hypothetical protein
MTWAGKQPSLVVTIVADRFVMRNERPDAADHEVRLSHVTEDANAIPYELACVLEFHEKHRLTVTIVAYFVNQL